MDYKTRAAQREAYKLKNERRRASKRKSTSYAVQAAEDRKGLKGFGRSSAAQFNKLAEGTTAMRRTEIDLVPGSVNGSAKEAKVKDQESTRIAFEVD